MKSAKPTSRFFDNPGAPVERLIVRLIPNDSDFEAGLDLDNENPAMIEFRDPRFSGERHGSTGRTIRRMSLERFLQLSRSEDGAVSDPFIADWGITAPGLVSAREALGERALVEEMHDALGPLLSENGEAEISDAVASLSPSRPAVEEIVEFGDGRRSAALAITRLGVSVSDLRKRIADRRAVHG